MWTEAVVALCVCGSKQLCCVSSTGCVAWACYVSGQLNSCTDELYCLCIVLDWLSGTSGWLFGLCRVLSAVQLIGGASPSLRRFSCGQLHCSGSRCVVWCGRGG